MSQVKGFLVLGLIKFIKKDKKEALPRISAMMPPETRKFMDEHILPAGWYPYRLLPDLLRAVDKNFGSGDLSYCIEQGRLSASHDLSTVFKGFAANPDPKVLMRQGMILWNSYYDVGKTEMRFPSDGEAVMVIEDFQDIDMAHVKSTQGWMEQYFSMCGYEDVLSEITKCQCNGDPDTELRFRFKPKAR